MNRPRVRLVWLRWLVLLALSAGSCAASVFVDLLEKVRQSEWVFDRAGNNAPFPNLAQVDVYYYPHREVSLDTGTLQFDETVLSEGCIFPAWIGARDMFVLGQYLSWNDVNASAPSNLHGQVISFLPIVAWAHQFDRDNQGGVFYASDFSRGHNFPGYSLTSSESYAGAVAIHWSSDRVGWFYGLVYHHENGTGAFYPYAGLLWQPNQVWSVSLVFPWLGVAYAPNPDFYVSLGVFPAGAVFDRSLDGKHLSVSHSSWNLMLAPHWQLRKHLWLTPSVGLANLGNFTVTTNGSVTLEAKLSRSPVWQLELSFKP